MTEKLLGKINSVSFGMGGYDDAQFGISFDLGSGCTGVGDFWGFWASKPSPGAKWDENDQTLAFGKVMMKIRDIMKAAKVSKVEKLAGVPVEMEIVDSTLKSWRVLTEVI